MAGMPTYGSPGHFGAMDVAYGHPYGLASDHEDNRVAVGSGLQRLDFSQTASASIIHSRGASGAQGATASTSASMRDAPADYAPMDYARSLSNSTGLNIHKPKPAPLRKVNPWLALVAIGLSLYLISRD